ncbi:hypothetical protein ECC02_009883 [Trypanosoma cruzi]|uniref:Uncharacterized protein n=1 Tax=Trypanosoma cruzi TaxID=5693 RepID=A0A7J6XSL3_TRYCR|nr:hypothetical protein ECC02_009883 [Trypanosoma cruzi]
MKAHNASSHPPCRRRKYPPPSPSSSSRQPTGNGKNPRPPHNAHGASTHHTSHTEQTNPHPSITRHQNFQPSRPQWDTEPNSTQSHAVLHTRRKEDSGCALPLPPFSSWPRKKTTAATRNCQHALQKKHSNPLQCASCGCVVVCACRNTKQKSRKERRKCGETQKNVQRRCMAETKRRRPLKLMTALQPKQWQFTQDLFKIKKLSPSSYTNPITQNNYK